MQINESIVIIKKAIELAKTGEKRKARHLLSEVIRVDRKNFQAWYVLSFVVDEKEKKLECLRRVLRYEPEHKGAQQQLRKLRATAVELTNLKIAGASNHAPVAESNKTNKQQQQVTSNNFTQTTTTSASNALITTHIVKSSFHSRQQSSDNYLIDETRAINPPQEEYNDPDILKILFDDIARLPIITNQHQELWLGVQLQALSQFMTIAENWHTSSSNKTITFTEFLCQTLLLAWKSLEQECFKHELPVPKLEIWISELLSARSNVYGLHRSRLRRFILRVQAALENDSANNVLILNYSVAETLAIFPGNLLSLIADYIITHQVLPTAQEIACQLSATFTEIQEQVKYRKKQTEQVLVTGYLRYAMRVAQGYIGQGLDYIDLVQAGFMGLLRAAQKYDYRIHGRFGNYATSWIWQAVGREIGDQGRTIRLPIHVQESLRKWQAACDQFDDGYRELVSNPHILFHAGLFEQGDYSKLQSLKDPLPAKLAARYKSAMRKALKLHSYVMPVVPLKQIQVAHESHIFFVEELNQVEYIEFIPDETSALETDADFSYVRQVIEEQIFPFLMEREREILELRFGWHDGEQRTLEEVGKVFGLTRERIRQIEAKAYKKLEKRRGRGLLPNPNDLLPEEKPALSWYSGIQMKLPLFAAPEENNLEISKRVNKLLSQLPRSDWVQGRSNIQSGQRQEQLVAALEQVGTPAHVNEISEQVNDIVGKELDDSYVYTTLIRDEATFVLLGQGIFSLVKWENARAKQSQPVLPCCPIPLPDPPDYEDAFFESVLVGQQALKNGLTAGEFVRYMLDWANADNEAQKWFLQAILSAYYLVDLIPYVFYFGGDDPTLPCTLPTISIQDLRYHCLETVTERLVAMPEFWWLFQKQQPVRPTDLGEAFADIHPYGLDDVLQRLRLLMSLGAAQKMKYGEYRLTPLGEECANKWKREMVSEISFNDNLSESDKENNFSHFISW